MRNRHIIVSILLLSLNSFADAFDVYKNFLEKNAIFPTTANCNFNKLKTHLPTIVNMSINSKYLTYTKGEIKFTNGSIPSENTKIMNTMNSVCEKITNGYTGNIRDLYSTGTTGNGNAATTPASAPTITNYNLSSGKTNEKKDNTTATLDLGNKTETCQYGSTQCNADNTPKPKIENSTNVARSTWEKDTNGYSASADDFGDRKKSTVTDTNGNYIVSDTTTGKNGKQHIEMEAFDKDGKPISLKSLPPEMKDKAKAIAEVTGKNKDEYSKDKKGEEAAKKETDKKAKSESTLNRLQSVNTAIQTEIDKCENNSFCKKSSEELRQAEKYAAQAQAEQAKCDGSSSKANFLCPTATNPQVQAVGGLMNGLSAMMPSISSAKATCAATSSVNLIGQTTLGVATAVCGGFKVSCEKTCAETNKRYEDVKKAYNVVSQNLDSALSEAESEKKCAETDKQTAETNKDPSGITKAQAEIKKQEENIAAINAAKGKIPETDQIIDNKSGENSADIAKCDGYKVEIAQIGTTALNMMAASLQAKKCEEQLSAMNGTGNTPQTYTMEEMCAQPANATSSICKCRSDNTAVGCPGYIAGSKNEGNLNKELNTSGVSGMASISYASKVKPNGAFSSGTDLNDLSDEAKAALVANGDPKPSASMFDAAGGANAGSGGGTSAGAAGVGADKGKLAQEPKSFGSSFVNAVSSLFKGGSNGKAAATKNDKFNADKYKEQIKRQIAAEQMRSEVSSASGMDNWSKIKSRYKSNASSLIESN